MKKSQAWFYRVPSVGLLVPSTALKEWRLALWEWRVGLGVATLGSFLPGSSCAAFDLGQYGDYGFCAAAVYLTIESLASWLSAEAAVVDAK